MVRINDIIAEGVRHNKNKLLIEILGSNRESIIGLVTFYNTVYTKSKNFKIKAKIIYPETMTRQYFIDLLKDSNIDQSFESYKLVIYLIKYFNKY